MAKAVEKESVWKRGITRVFKKFNFFLLKINFLYVLDCFDVLILKMIFKK
jgi:hypothetical protein